MTPVENRLIFEEIVDYCKLNQEVSPIKSIVAEMLPLVDQIRKLSLSVIKYIIV